MLSSFPLAFRHWSTFLLISLSAILCAVLLDERQAFFVFLRMGLANLEWYRIFTHAFFHTNIAHLLLNLSGMFLLWALHGDYYRPLQMFFLFCWCVLISAMSVWGLSPHIDNYMGLSAALHGIFCWGACLDVKQKRKTGYLLLMGMGLKLISERLESDSFSEGLIQASIAYDAHIYGALAGIAYYLCFTHTRTQKPDKSEAL